MTNKFAAVQRSLIAAAALAAVAGAANAQSSVTLYGRVDAGFQYSNKTAADDERLVELLNGGIRPSIWGLKGTEDLGGGLNAFFNLEAHFDSGTGVGARTGQAFRRQANVGLKGDWGTVTLGRQYSPTLLETLATEPRAYKEQFSGLYTYALNQNPAGNPVNDIGIFIGNAVSYSNKFGPFSISGAVAAGEGTGKTYSAGASYTGPVIVTLGYQKIEVPTDEDDGTQFYSAGVGVPLGPFTIKGQWQHAEEDVLGARVAKVDVYGVGADFAWNAANTLNVSFYFGKDKDSPGENDETKTLIISNDYALSKRTTLYAQFAIADADVGATARTSVIANGVFPDEKTSVFGVGISHNF